MVEEKEHLWECTTWGVGLSLGEAVGNRELGGGMGGRVGWGLHSFPGRALSRGSFSS